jgi:hypothetical protein
MSWQIRCCGVKIDTSLSQYHAFEMDLAFNYSTWMVNFRPKRMGPLFPFFMFSNFYNTKMYLWRLMRVCIGLIMLLARMYEQIRRNPGIIYWQIRQPVAVNMCTSCWIVSLVALLEV